ncbi:terminase small subunit [Companilactobacillus kimchiensis]|uniref:Prophage terminase small subunit n=1 Tax=Companilactobacillus kimchiensis TaxID=993692 RepID=A0A0R2LGG8_9LACO|nr:terminase small subunit [Companilactobacillus kimchiensis]KRO00905.1 prophage terminase small subunit [Companilactobacillus kimchiensis]
MDKKEKAAQDYSNGMKYKDISAKYDIPINTLKSWRSREKWKRDAPATKKLHPQTKKVAPKIVDELEANSELNDKQKLFCLFYLQRFNATWAYQKAYGVNYDNALRAGPRLMGNVGVKDQLAKLKKQLHSDIYISIDDIVKEYAKQAFASLGDVLDYKVHKEIVMDNDGNAFLDTEDNPVEKHVADIYLKPSEEIDWSLVQEMHRGKDGLVVKLYDKQKALDSLTKLADTFKDKDDNNMIQIIDDIEGDDEDGAKGKT